MPTKRSPLQRTSQSRVWIIEDRAGPANPPEYQSWGRAAGLDWGQGDTTPVRVPSDENYDDFDIIDQLVGQEDLPSLSLEFRMSRAKSRILQLVRGKCPFDVQLHVGACRTPTDFDGGFEKIHVLEGARATSYGTGDLGAFDKDQEAPGQENVPVSGLDWYEIVQIAGSEVAETEAVNEVVSVNICDSRTCGECGIPSNGCDIVLAVCKPAGGSAGLPARVVLTSDGGLTWDTSTIDTLPVNSDPDDAACVGPYYVVISAADDSIHYTLTQDLVDGDEDWIEVTTGIVAAGSPRAILSLGAVFTWLVGDGGYVYFTSDITAGVTVQSAGTVVVGNLAAIAAVDVYSLVAVGANNAVIKTANGGQTWVAVTGPAPGVALTTVAMVSENEWLIGTATGLLYYTRNGGKSWTQKAFPGSGSGSVDDIKFSSPTVGYMSHRTTAPAGRVLRTVNGGFSWYVLPEAQGITLPVSDYINSLGVCSDDVNLVYAGGLAGDGTDGILIKIA